MLLYKLKDYIRNNSITLLDSDLNYNFSYTYEEIAIDWSRIDESANPIKGQMPVKRLYKKCHQLENFGFIFKSLVNDRLSEKLEIVDFCSGK
jgi:hypothetical protein